MTQRIQLRRGTATQWTTANPILASGEIGFETDTNQFKIGNGTDNWSALEYITGNSSVASFLDLTDTPDSYISNKGKVLIVNDAEDGLVFSKPLTAYMAGGRLIENFEETEFKLNTELVGAWTKSPGGYNSSYCMTSGYGYDMTDYMTIRFTLVATGILEFVYKTKVFNQNDSWNQCKCSLNGTEILSIKNDINWTIFQQELVAGAYELKFYRYNEFSTNYTSQWWIDDISIPANGIYNMEAVSQNPDSFLVTSADGSYVGFIPKDEIGGGAGVDNFLDLIDTPDSYISNENKIVKINSGGTGLEFADTISTNDGIDGGNSASTYSPSISMRFAYQDIPSRNLLVSKTLELDDKTTIQICNSTSDITITIPLFSSVAFPVDSEIVFVKYGTGAVSFVGATADVVIKSSGSKTSIANQYEAVTLKKISENEWLLLGALG